MYISTEAAERIVREVSLAVDRPVNLMNDHGIIIASTDLSRIGTLHQGAYESIRDNMDCLIVRSDSDYPGSRIGINIPIRFEGQIAGVVGIRGDDYEELNRYIRLIRTTAETLLRESALHPLPSPEAAQDRLLKRILFEQPLSEKQIWEYGRQYGLSMETSYHAAVVIADQALTENGTADPVKTLNNILPAPGTSSFFCTAPGCIVLLLHGFQGKKQELSAYLTSFSSALGVSKAPSPGFFVGYDQETCTFLTFCDAFLRARTACRTAQIRKLFTPVCYQDLTLELLSAGLSDPVRNTYLRRILPDMPPEQLHSYLHLLHVFYECNGSVEKTASALFVHKNTVQYQLKKLAKLTGFDPRNIRHAALWELVLLLYPNSELDHHA